MDEPKKIPGTGRGTGRALGSKNKNPSIPKVTKVEIASFFSQLTAENYRWRQRVKRVLDGGADAHEFRYWSQIALDRSIGTPAKGVIKQEQRPPVIFIGKPWDPDNPHNKAMDARSARMIEAKDQQLALEAADRKAAEVIEHGPAQPEPESEEGLERVIPPPPPDPSAYR